MWDEVSKVSLFGQDVYVWGLCCAIGALLFVLSLHLMEKPSRVKKGTSSLLGLVSLIAGFLFSRVLFCLLDRSLGFGIPLNAWYRVDGGGASMFGALGGVILACWLVSSVTDQSFSCVADLAAPAFLLFVIAERIGEHWIPDFGVSRQLEGEWISGSFLAVQGEYGAAYLATYFLEAACALILFIILTAALRKEHRDGRVGFLFLLLFGASQTLMESLRYDYHISISFVGLQQILAYILIIIAVIIAAVRYGKKLHGLSAAALVSLPVTVGLLILLEFALDRTAISKYLLYPLFILMLAVPVTLALLLTKSGKQKA